MNGEDLTATTNPVKEPDEIAELRQAFAQALDTIDRVMEGKSKTAEIMAEQAIYRAMEAQMWAVKAATWKH